MQPYEILSNQNRQIVASLDIGTHKTALVIAEVREDGVVNILGVGTAPTQGIRQGVVVHLDQAVQSIQSALKEAQLTAGLKIRDVIGGVSGEQVHSLNSRGVVGVSRPDHEITSHDVARVIEAASAIALPPDRLVIHVLPQEYIVDNQGQIKDPIGLSGVRLEAEVHIVTCQNTLIQNLHRCIGRAGLRVTRWILESLASAEAVLDVNDKELGVALIDMGGESTELAVFYGGTIRHRASVALGGQHVTNDIALGLKTSVEQAEILKRKYGRAIPVETETGEEVFMVKGVGGRESREVSTRILTAIIQPRMEEIFNLVGKELQRSEYKDRLSAGLVLTGGGALLPRTDRLAERVFGIDARIGIPRGVGGLAELVETPAFATGVGLILYEGGSLPPYRRLGSRRGLLGVPKWIQTIRHYLDEYFK